MFKGSLMSLCPYCRVVHFIVSEPILRPHCHPKHSSSRFSLFICLLCFSVILNHSFSLPPSLLPSYFLLSVLEIALMTLCMLGKHSPTKQQLNLLSPIIFLSVFSLNYTCINVVRVLYNVFWSFLFISPNSSQLHFPTLPSLPTQFPDIVFFSSLLSNPSCDWT